jgi:hypothetical protein
MSWNLYGPIRLDRSTFLMSRNSYLLNGLKKKKAGAGSMGATRAAQTVLR